MKKRVNKTGFTLVELIVGLGLGALIVTTLFSITVSGFKQFKTIENSEKLHSNAVFLLNTMSYWIMQAKDASAVNSSDLLITLPDQSNPTKEIKQDGTVIKIGSDDGTGFKYTTVTPGDIQVTALSFTKMTHSVQINFTILLPETNETFSVKTTVALRNN